MTEFKLNTNIINANYDHGNNHVRYVLFTSDKDPGDMPTTEKVDEMLASQGKTEWCFSVFRDGYSGGHNKILYRVEVYHDILSLDEMNGWVQLSKKHGLLPNYVADNPFRKEEIEHVNVDGRDEKCDYVADVIISLEDVTPSILYVYLCTLRNCREDPGLVKCTLHLVEDHGMDFFPAYVYSSTLAVNYDLHHIIYSVRHYGLKGKDPHGLKTSLKDMIGLCRYIKNPSKFDDRKLTDNYRDFRCNEIIGAISRISDGMLPHDLVDEDVVMAIYADDDKESRKYIDTYLKRKECQEKEKRKDTEKAAGATA